MKVLHIISSSGFYGAENVLINITRALKDNKHSPYLICIKGARKPDPEIHSQAKKNKVPSMIISCSSKLDISAVMKIRGFIKKEGIQILHAHGYKSNIYGLIASKLARVPIIVTNHLWTGETRAVRFYEWLDRLIINNMNHIVSVSPLIMEELKALHIKDERKSLILNGIDTEYFNPSGVRKGMRDDLKVNGDLVIGTVGRLCRQKGQAYLIKAFKELCELDGHIKLIIAGDGDLKEQLVDEVKELKLEDKVIFVGTQKDMVSLYNSLDIFVLPSLTEGLPMVMLEAMSMKLPVVATRVGGIPDVIQKNEAILVSPQEVGELKDAVLRLMHNPLLRKEMGEMARARVVSDFSLDAFGKKYIGIYEKVIKYN